MSYISFQPKDYFNTKLWTGTGSSNAITGVGFQPDWVWIKNRSATESHRIHDACLLYTSPSPRDRTRSRMPSSA